MLSSKFELFAYLDGFANTSDALAAGIKRRTADATVTTPVKNREIALKSSVPLKNHDDDGRFTWPTPLLAKRTEQPTIVSIEFFEPARSPTLYDLPIITSKIDGFDTRDIVRRLKRALSEGFFSKFVTNGTRMAKGRFIHFALNDEDRRLGFSLRLRQHGTRSLLDLRTDEIEMDFFLDFPATLLRYAYIQRYFARRIGALVGILRIVTKNNFRPAREQLA